MKAQQLAQQTGARLVMPSVHLYERIDYVPSWHHVTRTATVPYLCGKNGTVTGPRIAHPSVKR